MTRAGKLSRLRAHLARGVKKVKRVAGYNRRRRGAIKRLLAEQGAIVMYDDVDLALIPAAAPAVAGYVDGAFQTFDQLRAQFPHAWKLSIAVTAEDDAHCLDVETGDAVPAEVADWLHRQFAGWAGEKYRPVVYSSKSQMPEVIAACEAAGIKRGRYRVWSADWTFQPHICAPSSCGASFTADATQWTDRANGQSLDQSLCTAGFFPGTR